MIVTDRTAELLAALERLDRENTRRIRENYQMRDRVSALEAERNALIAFVAGEGSACLRDMVEAECLRRWRDRDFDGLPR